MVRPIRERDSLLADVFEREYVALCRLALLLVGNRSQAEEVVMEAFTRTCRSWMAIRDTDRVDLYVRRAVVNEARNQQRKRGNERVANQRWTARTDGMVPGGEADEEVLAAVRALPPRQQAAVALHYLEDLSERDTATVLGCSPGTVKSQLSKARAALGHQLRQETHS